METNHRALEAASDENREKNAPSYELGNSPNKGTVESLDAALAKIAAKKESK